MWTAETISQSGGRRSKVRCRRAGFSCGLCAWLADGEFLPASSRPVPSAHPGPHPLLTRAPPHGAAGSAPLQPIQSPPPPERPVPRHSHWAGPTVGLGEGALSGRHSPLAVHSLRCSPHTRARERPCFSPAEEPRTLPLPSGGGWQARPLLLPAEAEGGHSLWGGGRAAERRLPAETRGSGARRDAFLLRVAETRPGVLQGSVWEEKQHHEERPGRTAPTPRQRGALPAQVRSSRKLYI